MEGTFELLGPLDLLQLLARGGKKGVFQIVSPGGKGVAYLAGPRVRHARWGSREGEEALMEILLLKEGRFRFIEGGEPTAETLSEPLDYYLLQAVRRLDDRIEVGPFDLVQLGSGSGVSHLTLSPDELALFTHLSKQLSALELAARSKKPLGRVLATLGHLARLNIIEIERRAPHTARLTLAIRDPLPPYAYVDDLLLRAWKLHYGHFEQVHIRAEGRTITLPVRGGDDLGGHLMLPTELLIVHELTAGQTLLVWPALPGSESS
ncbi:DUF4388 domain-containing protein [Oceanithermus sp.]